MGVVVENFNRRPVKESAFVESGSCLEKILTGQKTRMLVVSRIDGKTGTVFLAGKTGNLAFELFENDLDDDGHSINADLIEESGKKGIFVYIEKEQELLITNKRKKAKEGICVFISQTPEEMVEKLLV